MNGLSFQRNCGAASEGEYNRFGTINGVDNWRKLATVKTLNIDVSMTKRSELR